MGQIVLWDKFSHKGNKSLIALLDFIFNTGEYIIMVCHAQKVVDQMFSRVSVHIARKSPPTLPHPPGFGKRGTTPCERYNTFKISGFTADGEFVKGSACWPQQTPSLQFCQRRR